MHIDEALDKYIESLSTIKKVDKSIFSTWKRKVLDAAKTELMRPKFTTNTFTTVLGDPLVSSKQVAP